MKNLKIKTKLITGFAALALLTFLVGIAGTVGLCVMGDALNVMYEQKARPLLDLSAAIENMQKMRVLVKNCVLFVNDSETIKATDEDIQNSLLLFEQSMNNFEKSLTTQEGVKLCKERDLPL